MYMLSDILHACWQTHCSVSAIISAFSIKFRVISDTSNESESTTQHMNHVSSMHNWKHKDAITIYLWCSHFMHVTVSSVTHTNIADHGSGT